MSFLLDLRFSLHAVLPDFIYFMVAEDGCVLTVARQHTHNQFIRHSIVIQPSWSCVMKLWKDTTIEELEESLFEMSKNVSLHDYDHKYY